jgi:hypothetical protein
MAQHGQALPYDTAWALITLTSAPDETDLVRAWANLNSEREPGVHYDQWCELSHTEQHHRRQWLHRHGHSPIQLLRLDSELIKSAGIRVIDWGTPHAGD